MTQEDKKILLKDLCARLPYGFTVHRYSDNRDITFGENELDEFSHFLEYSERKEFKPYLRPMSSMTAEEREEIEVFICDEWFVDDDKATKVDSEGFIEFLSNYDCSGIYPEFCGQYVDWLLSHHFDYRIDPSTGKTLIESGLALEAPKDMYKNE